MGSAPMRSLNHTALRQHGLLTRSQAAGAGCSDEVLQRLCREGTLERVERGVYRYTNVPRSFEQRVLAACLARTRGVACRRTAMRLYGFELDPSEAGFEDRPEITCSNPRRQSRGGRHVVHSSPIADGDVVVRRGIPMTSPGRTLRDVAGIVPPPTLDRFLGHLLATRDIVPAQLRQHLDASGRSVPGAPELRAAMERAGMTVAPDSVLEHRATVLLRAAGLPEASPHFPIHAEGRLVGIVDFAWPADRVVLEVDGYRWHADPRTFAGDRRRDNRSRELGWAVYRTTSAELGAGAGPLLRQLGQALGRSHRPAAPAPAV